MDGDRVGKLARGPGGAAPGGRERPGEPQWWCAPSGCCSRRFSAADQMDGAANVLRGRLAEVAYLGTARRYVVDLERGGTVEARIPVRED